MRCFSAVLYGCGLVLLAAIPSKAQTPANESVLARIDGRAITIQDMNIAAEDPALSLQGVSEEQKRELLTSYLVDLTIGARAAEAAGLGSGPDFAKRVAYARDKILIDSYLMQEVKKAVTAEALQKLYQENVASRTPEQEVRARHILVENEDEAKKALARVKNGENFAKVASELSKDPGSGKEGGDLGFFTKERMVPPFAEAAFKLEVGQISDLVKTQFGWHIIKVEERRQSPVPTFEAMKPQLENYLARKTQQDVILSLRAKAKIERPDQPASQPNAPNNPPDAKKP
jgi:peptidyl-prolyl cis-trans isomerase C